MRIATIGLGIIGSRHLGNLKKIRRAEIAGICDLDKQKAKVAQKEFGGKVYSDFKVMFDKEQLDAVLICTPQTVRYEPIVEAARRGIAIFCEKPPAFDLKTASKIQNVIKETKVLNNVGFMWRHNRITDRAKELLQQHNVALMHSDFLCGVALNPSLPAWFLLKERSGGPLLDQAIHLLDVSRYLLGDITKVQALGANIIVPKNRKVTIEDSHSLNLQFASGVVGSHLHSWSHRGWIAKIELYGEHSHLSVDYANNSIKGKVGAMKIDEKMRDDPYMTELEQFLDAVQQKRQEILRSSYDDAIRTLAIAIAANKSIQTEKMEKVIV